MISKHGKKKYSEFSFNVFNSTVLSLIFSFGCNQREQTDFNTMSWRQVNENFAYHLTDSNTKRSVNSKLLQLDLLGYINSDDRQFVSRQEKDSSDANQLLVLAEASFDVHMKSGHKRNSEGYLKIDFFKEFNLPQTVRIYLNDSITEERLDSLKRWLQSHDYVKTAEFVSKDDAVKKYIQEQNEDPREMLRGYNPLPASFEITFRNLITNEEDFAKFKKEVLDRFPFETADIVYPRVSLKMSKDKLYIFHFKSR